MNYFELSEDDINLIVEMYRHGSSAKDIKYIYPKVSERRIIKIIRDTGNQVRQGKRFTYIEKEDFFESIDSPNKAYILGLLLSDGYITYPQKDRSNRAPSWGICLNENDKYILEFIKQEIGINKALYARKHNKTIEYYLSVSSSKMVTDLSKYGVIPRKSTFVRIPFVDKLFLPDLIRGIFDGDGCITKQGICSFCGNKNMVTDIRETLINELHISPNKLSNRKNSLINPRNMDVYAFYFSSKKDKTNFYNYIYYNNSVPCLTRKRNLIYQFIQ